MPSDEDLKKRFDEWIAEAKETGTIKDRFTDEEITRLQELNLLEKKPPKKRTANWLQNLQIDEIRKQRRRGR